MKIVLLGKSGMLGSAFSSKLKEANCDLLEFDRSNLDISNFDKINDKLDYLKPDFVINCAAYTDVDACEANKERAFLINGESVRVIAMACRRIAAKLIHFSTDYVFDGLKENGYSEDDFPNPINIYGESKLLGEQYVKNFADQYAIIRTSWLFGPDGSNFVDTMLGIAQNNKILKIVNDQFGSPTYTYDLVDSVIEELIFNATNKNGIFHLTNSGTTSWFNFAREILSNRNVNIKAVSTDEFPRPAPRPNYSILLNTRLKPLRSFSEALRDYLTT